MHTMLLPLIIVLIGIGYYFLRLHYQYWEKRGVPGPRPTFVVGNLGRSFLLRKAPFEIFTDIYNQYQGLSVVGVFKTSTPTLLIRDPDLIREITVKSFDSFHDNDIFIDKNVDPLVGRNPFVLRGEEWKTVRTQLTPGFTSGKMKWVYPLLEDISKRLVTFIETQDSALNGEGYEAKELALKYTLNNVASCAFGLEGKCFEEEDSEFRQIAKKFLTPEGFNTVKIFLAMAFPPLTRLMSIKFTSREVEERLIDIVTRTLQYREENGIIRNDFLHIMHQLKKTCKDYPFTNLDVAAHLAGFFADGYETSSIVMSFLMYELAANSDIQSKLREEIDRHFGENDGRLPYDVLQEMPYLDAVVNELLRLHPPGYVIPKICTKTYTFVPKEGDGIEVPVVIEKDTSIILPIYGLQNDPKYFEQPERFRPERFMAANREKIRKYTFMPFGEGPRSCLGQRFAVLQIKVGVAYILRNFELAVNKKTKVPFTYSPLYFLTAPVGGIWIDFKKIK